MADCPKCGYALQPFDRTCPRCARQGESSTQQEIRALLSARKQPVPPAARRARRQLVLGVTAGTVIVAGGIFIFLQLHQPGSAFWSNRLASEAPQVDPSSRVIHDRAAPAKTPSPSPQAGDADKERRELLQQCPFNLRVGAEVGPKQADASAEVRINEQGGQVASLEIGAWRLQGAGGQLLQVEQQTTGSAETGDLVLRILWQDQPFEVYQNGQLVAKLANTNEYWSAQG